MTQQKLDLDVTYLLPLCSVLLRAEALGLCTITRWSKTIPLILYIGTVTTTPLSDSGLSGDWKTRASPKSPNAGEWRIRDSCRKKICRRTDLHDALTHYENIRRFDIAMHDPIRMNVVDAVEKLPQYGFRCEITDHYIFLPMELYNLLIMHYNHSTKWECYAYREVVFCVIKHEIKRFVHRIQVNVEQSDDILVAQFG